MARPSDKEFDLKRTIKELREENGRLVDEVTKLKRIIAKGVTTEPVETRRGKDKKKPPAAQKPCPDCGAEIKSTELPHAFMELCSKQCGYRNVRNKK